MSTMRNSVMLIGRPGVEPETRTFNDNRIVTRFNKERTSERHTVVHCSCMGQDRRARCTGGEEREADCHRRHFAQQRMDRQERPAPLVDGDPSEQLHPFGLG